jgi:glycosyltransferase involved in cell wall biosynthesis
VRTLMLAENLPYPTFKGGDLRNWQNVNALRRLGPVGVFGVCSNDRRTTRPRPDIALWQSSSDPELAFPPPPGRVARARHWLLEADGHPADTCFSPSAEAEVAQAIAAFQPDVVIVERLWLHRYMAAARRAGVRVVLDAHNVEAELSRQLAQSVHDDGLPGRRLRELLAERTASIEHKALWAADQVWVCSEQDRVRVKQSVRPVVDVHVVPNGVDVDGYAGNDAAPGEPPSVVFPAMFGYAPNGNAARFLIEALRPLLDDLRVVLVGAMPTAAMLEAARRDERIVVTGMVADVRPYVRSAIAVVVPLFEGSGTRFKILEAFAAGVPVVTTPMGADGLDVADGVHVLVARTAAEFAGAIRRLRAEPGLAQRLVREARALVERRYSWDAAAERIAQALATLVGTATA